MSVNQSVLDEVPRTTGTSFSPARSMTTRLPSTTILKELVALSPAAIPFVACLATCMQPDSVAAHNIHRAMIKHTSGQSKRSTKTLVWDGVAGMRELKAMLERDVILPLQEPEIYERYRLSLPNGILLYGPPGCGKTFVARKLATMLGFEFQEVKPGDLASIYVHGTQGKIAELFVDATERSPCLLFFDEIDAMIPNRGGDFVGHHYASEVNEFLVQLNECWRRKILVVGATNLPNRMDAAVLRPGRLDKKSFVGPPDYEARLELLRLCAANRPQETLDLPRVAGELEIYTCAEIEFVVNEAARTALAANRPIVTGDLLTAAVENPPAHTESQVQKMRNLE
ncbi:MAG: ATP-binding protein [Thermoguttaceae bacterium]